MTQPTIMVIFGTRPEAIKLFPVIDALRREGKARVLVCVTAQHRGLLDQVLQLADIVPDIDLDLMEAGQTLDRLTARLLTGLGDVLDQHKPDRVVVQGDTATAMVGALAAYYRRIPVSHVEAGLRSGDIYRPWPEEVNRRIVATMADQHFAPTKRSAEALLAEQIDPATVFLTGNPVIDALHATLARLTADHEPSAILEPLLKRFKGQRIIGMTTHRRENFDGGLDEVMAAMAEVASRHDVAVIFPVHPNPNVREAIDRSGLGRLGNVAMIDPLGYTDFCRLLDAATLMVSDSGGVQEEAPALGKPVLVLRDTTERQEGIDAGTALLVGTDKARIVAEATRLLDDPVAYAAMARAHNPFGDGKSALRIARLLVGDPME